MKFSALYTKYGGFYNPTWTLKVNKIRLNVGEGVELETLECRLTTLREAGALTLRAELDANTDIAKTWLDAIQLGAVCTLSLGYAGTEKTVFSGFVYEAVWDSPLWCPWMKLEMTCMDVRGQLMLSSCSDAGAARTLSQLVSKLLGQSCCTRMASAQVKAIPKDWDLPFQRTGPTDFEILCSAADFLCFEFYAYADTVYFGPARDSSETAVTFDGSNGLMRLRRRRSLAGQCAGVAVSGADDKEGLHEHRVVRRRLHGVAGLDHLGNRLLVSSQECLELAFVRVTGCSHLIVNRFPRQYIKRIRGSLNNLAFERITTAK